MDLIRDRMISKKTLHKEIVGNQEHESFETFQYFEERLSAVLATHLYKSPPTQLLNVNEKRLIFSLLWYVRSPQRARGNLINEADLMDFDSKFKQFTSKLTVKHEGKEITLLEYNILAAFYHVLYHKIKDKSRAGVLKEAFSVPILEGISMLKAIPDMYTACYSMLLSRLNDISKQCYSIEMLRSDGHGNLSMTLTPVLSVYIARKETMMIHGEHRLVYKVPNPFVSSRSKWMKIPREKLESHYTGDKDEMDFFIQIQAFKQMNECLNIFDQKTLNEILSFNLRHLGIFEEYKEDLLVPIHVFQTKVGYWVCDIIGDSLVIRAFRLISQSNTPEGDQLLANYSKLKIDIKRCDTDDLSLLFKVKDDVDLALFNQAGFKDIFRLKDYNLKIDAMQEADYKEFLSYIKQGENAELRVSNVEQEDLTLQDYSLLRLLSLLVLNTIGLIVAHVMKLFYSLASKLKGLTKQNVTLNKEVNTQGVINLSNAELVMRNEIKSVQTSERFQEQVS